MASCSITELSRPARVILKSPIDPIWRDGPVSCSGKDETIRAGPSGLAWSGVDNSAPLGRGVRVSFSAISSGGLLHVLAALGDSSDRLRRSEAICA